MIDRERLKIRIDCDKMEKNNQKPCASTIS